MFFSMDACVQYVPYFVYPRFVAQITLYIIWLALGVTASQLRERWD